MILQQFTKPQLLPAAKEPEQKHMKKLSSQSDPAAPDTLQIVPTQQKPHHKKNKSEIPPINIPIHIFFQHKKQESEDVVDSDYEPSLQSFRQVTMEQQTPDSWQEP